MKIRESFDIYTILRFFTTQKLISYNDEELSMNRETRIRDKFRIMFRAYLIALFIVVPILYIGFRLHFYGSIF